jgi:hypothetical protein
MSHQLIITLLVLAAELGLFALCVVISRRPIDPLKPRLVPYNIIMIFLAVAIFATAAHVISLLTGQQLMPRQRKGMR